MGKKKRDRERQRERERYKQKIITPYHKLKKEKH